MPLRQPIIHRRRQQKSGLPIHVPKIAHPPNRSWCARQSTLPHYGHLCLKSDSLLEPLPATIAGHFNLWLGREERAGRTYNKAQRAWLAAIRDFIAVNVSVGPEDLIEAPDFVAQGGLVRAHALFGDRLKPLLDELPEVLIA